MGHATMQRWGYKVASLQPDEFGYISAKDVCLGRKGCFHVRRGADLLPDPEPRQRPVTVVVFREGENWYVDTAGVRRSFHPTDPPGSNEYVPAEGRAHNVPVQEAQVSEKSKRKERRGVRQIAAPAPKQKPKPAPKKQAPAPKPVPAAKQAPARSTRQPSRAAQAAPAPKPAGTTVAVAERKTVTTQPVKLGSLKPKQQMWLDLNGVDWGLDPAKQSVKVKITGNGFHHLLAYHEPCEGRLPVKKERGSVWVLTDIGKRKPAWLPVGPG